MYWLKKDQIPAMEIAEYLNQKLVGADFLITQPSSWKNIQPHSMVLCDSQEQLETVYRSSIRPLLIIVPDEVKEATADLSIIRVSNPKAAYTRIVNEFFVDTKIDGLAKTACIRPGAQIGEGVSIGEHSYIGEQVEIGRNTRILNNVVITGRVKIGSSCLIKDNSSVGSEGYEFVESDGEILHLPHVGKIVIGNNVWIGANCSIETPTIDDTLIGDRSKLDDLVHIGSETIIGKEVMISAGAILSRNICVGDGCEIGINACIREHLVIGEKAQIGMGAVVIDSLAPGNTYVGNPAKYLRGRLA
jgi:UDP-3-O-[3-hydroxymyristoyl] glucosamine N-acyltransferase